MLTHNKERNDNVQNICLFVCLLLLKSQAWWDTPVILGFRRGRKGNQEFEASLSYKNLSKAKQKQPGLVVHSLIPALGRQKQAGFLRVLTKDSLVNKEFLDSLAT